jgi:hypothetical protein
MIHFQFKISHLSPGYLLTELCDICFLSLSLFLFRFSQDGKFLAPKHSSHTKLFRRSRDIAKRNIDFAMLVRLPEIATLEVSQTHTHTHTHVICMAWYGMTHTWDGASIPHADKILEYWDFWTWESKGRFITYIPTHPPCLPCLCYLCNTI